MKSIQDNWLWFIIGAIVFFALVKQCEKEPKIITKTETKTIIKTDTITGVVIKEVPKEVFVERIVNEKGETKIIYVKDTTAIKANQYDTKLESNEATADLKITTTGELLDVFGTITYPEKETTTTITKTKPQSGLYLYGNLPVNNLSSPEIGALYQFRNTMFVSGGVQYNSITRQPDFKVGIGIKIW